jgi:hypothetical protein
MSGVIFGTVKSRNLRRKLFRAFLLGTVHEPGRSKRFFSAPQRPDRLWGLPSFLARGVPRLKRLSLEADHSPPCSAEVKNGGVVHSHVFMAWCLIKHRNNFTSYFFLPSSCGLLKMASNWYFPWPRYERYARTV